jgi:hypothetical protein
MRHWLSAALLFLAACAPQVTDAETEPLPQAQPPLELTLLIQQTLQIPDSQASVLLDAAILVQERTAYQASGADRGTLRLFSNFRLHLQLGDMTYLLMPLEVSRIVGDSGLYLLLFAWQNETLVQLDSSYLGPALNVRALELTEDQITITAIDRRLGRLPDIQRPPVGGVFRFVISESRLVQLE